MPWKIEYAPRAFSALKKNIDREVARRILAKLEQVAAVDDPASLAKPLRGNLKGLWSYRITSGYRVIVDIQPERLVIVALEAGPRRDVYEK